MSWSVRESAHESVRRRERSEGKAYDMLHVVASHWQSFHLCMSSFVDGMSWA